MFRFLHLLTPGKFAAALQMAVTAGAVAGGAAWAVSLDDRKVTYEPVPVPAPPSERASIPEMPGVAIRVISPTETVFIVESEEAAVVMRARSREIADFQLQSGLPPAHDDVIVVTGRSEALLLGEALTRESSIMSASGKHPFDVVVVPSVATP